MHLRVCAAFQRDLSRLEKQVICWKHMKFCKGILPPSPAPGDKKAHPAEEAGASWLENSSDMLWASWAWGRWGLWQQRRPTGSWAVLGTLHLCSAPETPRQAQLCSPQVQKRSSNTGAGPAKGPEGVEELENLSWGETERAGVAQKLKWKPVLKARNSLQLKYNI